MAREHFKKVYEIARQDGLGAALKYDLKVSGERTKGNLSKGLVGFMLLSAPLYSGCEGGGDDEDSAGEVSSADLWYGPDCIQTNIPDEVFLNYDVVSNSSHRDPVSGIEFYIHPDACAAAHKTTTKTTTTTTPEHTEPTEHTEPIGGGGSSGGSGGGGSGGHGD